MGKIAGLIQPQLGCHAAAAALKPAAQQVRTKQQVRTN
jgi:hypothetical protein